MVCYTVINKIALNINKWEYTLELKEGSKEKFISFLRYIWHY